MLAALAAALALAAPPAEPLDRLAAALRSAPPGGARAAAATAPLVGAPYLPSALGEGAGPDPDPRFRLDAFDCMTFVETAVALGSASSPAEAARALDDIRYDGPAALAARNHEVLSQWIPQNAAKGWIVDVGPELAGARAPLAEKTYTPESWALVRTAGRAIPGLPRRRLPLGRFAVHVVPAAAVAALARDIPEGALAFVVRADRPDRATRITHAGVVVRGPAGAVHVRHATSSKGVGRVIEEPIERFLRRQERALPRWPFEGLAILAIRDNRERLRALPAPGPSPSRRAEGPLPPPPPRL